jgi:hypothetical protein
MSRGPGRIERGIIERLTACALYGQPGHDVKELALALYDPDLTKAEERPGVYFSYPGAVAHEKSIRRALRRLEARGVVKRTHEWVRTCWVLTNPPAKPKPKAKRQRSSGGSFTGLEDLFPPRTILSAGDRERLAKILGMLGSKHEGERASAALMADELRRQYGVQWVDLLRS